MEVVKDDSTPVILYPSHSLLPQLSLEQFQSLPEDEQKWELYIRNPSDHTSWKALFSQVVKQDDLLKTRRTLYALLEEFPLCYGYWKHLANQEKRYGDIEKAFLVLEQGVKATPFSYQLWLHYGLELKAQGQFERARSVFRRGCAFVGTDARALDFWQAYLDLEREGGTSNFACVLEVLIRTLSCPLEDLEAFYETFQQLAAARPTIELQTAVRASRSITLELESSLEGKSNQMDEENGSPSDRVELMAEIHTLFQQTKGRRDMLSPYMSRLKRPWFHFDPLPSEEVEGWRALLAFLSSQSEDADRDPTKPIGWKAHLKANLPLPYDETIKMFERALLPCAHYAEIWRVYAGFLEDYNPDAAHEVYSRAVRFVKADDSLYLDAALFEERVGNVECARRVLGEGLGRRLQSSELALALVNLQRRHASIGSVSKVYEAVLTHLRDKRESTMDTLCILTMHYTRYWQEFNTDDNPVASLEKCRQIYNETTNFVQANKMQCMGLGVMWQDWIHLELSSLVPGRMERVKELYERALSKAFKTLLSEESSRTLWENYVAFAEDRGSNVEEVLEIKNRAASAASQTKKRKAVDPAPQKGTQSQQVQPASSTFPTGYGGYDPSVYGGYDPATYAAYWQMMNYGSGYS